MYFLCCLAICLMSLFFGVKTSKVGGFVIMRNLSRPTFVFRFHPRKTSDSFQTMLIGSFAISSVLPICCLSKVFKPIIRLISINMINRLFWHNSCHVKPCKPMRPICFSIYFNINISSALLQIASRIANLYPWSRQRPSKDASFRVVRENGKKVRMFHLVILPEQVKDCNC